MSAILFHATAETLQTIAADPQHLGAQIGFFAVLHTGAKPSSIIRIYTVSSREVASRPIAPAGSRADLDSFSPSGRSPASFADAFWNSSRPRSPPAHCTWRARCTRSAIRTPGRALLPVRQVKWVVYANVPSPDRHKSWTMSGGRRIASRSPTIGSGTSTTMRCALPIRMTGRIPRSP